MPRIEIPGAHYHLGSRGNNKRPIFIDDDDRRQLLALIARTTRRHGWVVLAYALMTNHYHLVIQIGEAGMARGMCELNGGYATYFNLRHRRENHLFGRRYWDRRLESVDELLFACRYTVLNPTRAGLEPHPGVGPWTSYGATAGLEFAPVFLAKDRLLRFFGQTPKQAREGYVAFVSEGLVQGGPVRRQPPSRRRDEIVPPW